MPDVIELKITLADIDPEIWRRVAVPANYTLAGLHAVIQAAMGWENYHLHQFVIGYHYYGVPDPTDTYPGPKIREEGNYKLADVLSDSEFFVYVYDFGDDWHHEITVEKIRPAKEKETLPTCLAGKRACPPEDCGGPHGYSELLEALADPDHEEHEHLKGWAGDFEPERFDRRLANKRLKALTSGSRRRH